MVVKKGSHPSHVKTPFYEHVEHTAEETRKVCVCVFQGVGGCSQNIIKRQRLTD